MERFVLPLIVAVVLVIGFLALRSFGGSDDTDLPVELEAIEVLHTGDDVLVVRVVNNSENEFRGNVRIQAVQGSISVTKSIRFELLPFDVGEGELDSDWDVGEDAETITITVDPQHQIDDTNLGNNVVVVRCLVAEGVCDVAGNEG